MAVISKIEYDNGKIVYPKRSDIVDAKTMARDFDLGDGRYGKPTEDVDYVHVHTISASGRTQREAAHFVKAKMDRFFDVYGGKYGFSTLNVDKRVSTHSGDGAVTISYEILYVIEYRPTRANHHEPEPQYMGYQRDPSAVTRRVGV